MLSQGWEIWRFQKPEKEGGHFLGEVDANMWKLAVFFDVTGEIE